MQLTAYCGHLTNKSGWSSNCSVIRKAPTNTSPKHHSLSILLVKRLLTKNTDQTEQQTRGRQSSPPCDHRKLEVSGLPCDQRDGNRDQATPPCSFRFSLFSVSDRKDSISNCKIKIEGSPSPVVACTFALFLLPPLHRRNSPILRVRVLSVPRKNIFLGVKNGLLPASVGGRPPCTTASTSEKKARTDSASSLSADNCWTERCNTLTTPLCRRSRERKK